MHVFPDALFEAIWDWFDKHAWTIAHRHDSDRLIEMQMEAGVRGLMLLTYAHKPGMARELNQYLSGLVRRHSGTMGLAAAHPDDDDLPGILAEAFDQGLSGVKLHSHVLGRAMDEEAFFPIYETCLEADKWVLVHAGTQPAIAAYGMDVTQISGVARVERVLKCYPGLKLIIPHLGFDQVQEFMALLDIYPNLYLDTTMVLSGYFDVQVDNGLLARHWDRILYGSDFPSIPYRLSREVERIVARKLEPKVEAAILGGNAARLLNL